LAGGVFLFATSVLSEMNDHHREASKDAGKGGTQARLLYVSHPRATESDDCLLSLFNNFS
jgi:hypothetical protein